ncbi:carbonate dehydratase [Leucothrix pacifica]|uniref:Carbonic anhydrase n=1 Tax=Leucothrix pacifica TaxID=1247513 RepID=A0A317CCK0_9GAMM|nr:carbonate dehydratase [Leucothrix pacifica]PWQ96107.1 carbonate dehydratase [Leucothrix pacifica]
MLENIFENNRQWAKKILKKDPQFFEKLQEQQNPNYFWIGCSDSRVPASEIMNLLPGEVFVQRNVANQVVHSDMNCLTALQFAVDVLKVRHVIVCGHYSCGGVKAAYGKERHGLVDNWLLHVRDVITKHSKALDQIDNESEKLDRICELNVIEQVENICSTTTMEDAWARGQDIKVHGLIYSLKDGHLRNLNMSITGSDEVETQYQYAKQRIFS